MSNLINKLLDLQVQGDGTIKRVSEKSILVKTADFSILSGSGVIRFGLGPQESDLVSSYSFSGNELMSLSVIDNLWDLKDIYFKANEGTILKISGIVTKVS